MGVQIGKCGSPSAPFRAPLFKLFSGHFQLLPPLLGGGLVSVVISFVQSVRPVQGHFRFPSPCSGAGLVRRCYMVNLPFQAVGFCGSRSLAGAPASLARRVAAAVSAASLPVSVGCAAGADAAVRSACPSASVFSVRSGLFGSGPPAFARRSAALVRSLPAGSAFVGFVSSPCPSVVRPSPSSSRCFCGGGSGSWASLALAAGLGLSVFVFWAGSGSFPAPAWGSSWSPVSSGVFAGAFRFSAALSLF